MTYKTLEQIDKTDIQIAKSYARTLTFERDRQPLDLDGNPTLLRNAVESIFNSPTEWARAVRYSQSYETLRRGRP